MWQHLGRFVSYERPWPELPSDTMYFRHPSEVQYQRDMVRTLRGFMEDHSCCAEYNPEITRSNLSRPITAYYMFQQYKGWVEDAMF